jgi:hypothetical protein
MLHRGRLQRVVSVASLHALIRLRAFRATGGSSLDASSDRYAVAGGLRGSPAVPAPQPRRSPTNCGRVSRDSTPNPASRRARELRPGDSSGSQRHRAALRIVGDVPGAHRLPGCALREAAALPGGQR